MEGLDCLQNLHRLHFPPETKKDDEYIDSGKTHILLVLFLMSCLNKGKVKLNCFNIHLHNQVIKLGISLRFAYKTPGNN